MAEEFKKSHLIPLKLFFNKVVEVFECVVGGGGAHALEQVQLKVDYYFLIFSPDTMQTCAIQSK